jgi:hypothetical protein
MVFILAFLYGAVLGVGELGASGPSTTHYGIQGGIGGIFFLLIYYVFSFGIIPLVVTAIGAVLGLAVASSLRSRSR